MAATLVMMTWHDQELRGILLSMNNYGIPSEIMSVFMYILWS